MNAILKSLPALAAAWLALAAPAQAQLLPSGTLFGNPTVAQAPGRSVTPSGQFSFSGTTLSLASSGLNLGPAGLTGSSYSVGISGAFSKAVASGNANLSLLSSDAIASNPLAMALQVLGSATSNLRVGEIQVSEFGTAFYHTLSLNPLGGNVSIGLTSGTAAGATLDVVGTMRLRSFPAGVLSTDSAGNLFASATIYNNVKDTPFNAACNGSTNDAVAIQAAITAAASNKGPVVIPAATCVSGSLTWLSGVTIQGVSRDNSILKAHSSIAAGTYLLLNQNTASYLDSDITIKDLTIDGAGIGSGVTQTVTHGLVGFGFVTNLLIENVKVYNYFYNCVDMISVVRARVRNNEFTACGYTDHGVPDNGGSLFISTNSHLSPSTDVLVEGNNFHDANAMTFAVVNSVLSGNTFRNMGEVAVNYPRVPPEVLTRNNIISYNTFDGTHLLSVSASCIEAEGWSTQYIGNSFRNCGHDGIVLVNAQDIVVVGNTFSNVGKEVGFAASSAGIKIFSSAASPNQPQNITISGNHVFDDQTTVTTGAAVQLTYTGSGSTPVIDLSITGNDFSKTVFASGSVIKENTAGIIGAGSIIRNNLPISVNGGLPVAEGGTGSVVATGLSLDNITGFTGVGLLARAGGGVYRASTIVGTAAEITVTNGTGASADPTLSLPTALTFTGKTVTGGTFSGGTYGNAITSLTSDVTASGPGAAAATIANAAVTYAKFQNIAGLSVAGRSASSSGVGADITGIADQVLRIAAAGASVGFGAIDLSKTAAATGVLQEASFPALTGDVTTSAGAVATTIAANAVTNAKAAQMANSTIKCRTTAGTGNSEDCTATQAAAIIGGVGGALKSKIIASTRDLTAATGNVAYTGVGFTPTSCLANGAVGNSNSYASINGIADSALAGRTLFWFNSLISTSANFLAFVDATGANTQTATVASYDADGFTLAWTKAGSPTGTATLQFICYR